VSSGLALMVGCIVTSRTLPRITGGTLPPSFSSSSQKLRNTSNEMSASVANSPAGLSAPALERHYSPDELGEIWNLSADTVRRLFERENGVLVIEPARGNGRRRYRTLRIPESVALRVHRRMVYTG
jgi:hypothetical protein